MKTNFSFGKVIINRLERKSPVIKFYQKDNSDNKTSSTLIDKNKINLAIRSRCDFKNKIYKSSLTKNYNIRVR